MIKVERLEEAFPGHGQAVRDILDYDLSEDSCYGDDPIFERYPKTGAWVRSCYNPPGGIETRMALLNEELDAYGVEAIFQEGEKWPDLEYVNMGDAYVTTILYDRTRLKYLLMSWGDWIEEQEAKGVIYP